MMLIGDEVCVAERVECSSGPGKVMAVQNRGKKRRLSSHSCCPYSDSNVLSTLPDMPPIISLKQTKCSECQAILFSIKGEEENPFLFLEMDTQLPNDVPEVLIELSGGGLGRPSTQLSATATPCSATRSFVLQEDEEFQVLSPDFSPSCPL